jgi:hypothetical protein
LVFLGVKEVEPSKRNFKKILKLYTYIYIYIYITKEVKVEEAKLLKKP